MTSRDHLYREHGRLVARFKRQTRSKVRNRRKAQRIVATVTELMLVERMMLLSDLEWAALARDPDRLPEFVPAPTRAELVQRVRLMAPGAGLEIPS